MHLLLEDIAVVSSTFTVVCPLELNTGQIQEGVGEAINGIVKHFHKPEKEVKYYFFCENLQRKGLKTAYMNDLHSSVVERKPDIASLWRVRSSMGSRAGVSAWLQVTTPFQERLHLGFSR